MEFVPLGIVGPADDESPAMLAAPVSERSEQPRRGVTNRVGVIEIELSHGARVRVDAFVNEKALSRVFRAMKGSI